MGMEGMEMRGGERKLRRERREKSERVERKEGREENRLQTLSAGGYSYLRVFSRIDHVLPSSKSTARKT